MTELRGNRLQPEDELPVYLARPGTADPVPRQKRGGLFCSVQDAFECKTIDFDALSVGQRGSRTPRSDIQEERTSSIRTPSAPESPAESAHGGIWSPQTETRTSRGEEALQNLGDEKVRGLKLIAGFNKKKVNSVCFCLFYGGKHTGLNVDQQSRVNS